MEQQTVVLVKKVIGGPKGFDYATVKNERVVGWFQTYNAAAVSAAAFNVVEVFTDEPTCGPIFGHIIDLLMNLEIAGSQDFHYEKRMNH